MQKQFWQTATAKLDISPAACFRQLLIQPHADGSSTTFKDERIKEKELN